MRRWFSLSNYPIWFKVLLIVGIGVVLLILPAIVLARVAAEELALESASSYVSQVGAEQSNSIAANIVQAEAALTSFVNQPDNQRALMSLLLGDVNDRTVMGNLPNVRNDDIEELINETLLNPATTLYESIRLLDEDGQVIARAELSSAIGLATDDESDTPTYRAAVAADIAGETRVLNVSELYGIGVIDYVNAIQWLDGTTLGYLIGRISNQRAIYPNLRFPSDGYPGFSFLETDQGVILSPSEDRYLLDQTHNPALVSLGLGGSSGTQRFSLNDVELVGFYGPVRGTPMALVAQVNAAEALAQAAALLNTRNFAIVLGAALLTLVIAALFNILLASPLSRLRRAADAVSLGNLSAPIPETDRADEIGRLAGSFAAMRETLTGKLGDLENRVASRDRDIAATQDIARFAAAERDLEPLMARVVHLIIERFPTIYHAQIFLLDSDRQFAVVRASTGDVGRELLRRGHRLAVGSVSVIGQVTDQGKLILARNTATSQVHRRNEFLPDTLAELAIPLKLGDEVIGALDVQSKEADVFTDDLIAVLQTLAEQIAIAIQSARLYEENRRRMNEIETFNRVATLNVWNEYLRDERLDGLQKAVGFGETAMLSEMRERALQEGRIIVGDLTSRRTIPVAVPVMLRGQVLGAVEWELPQVGFGEDKLELAQELANRLAVSLENARLFAESRRATERERLVNTIATRLTSQPSLDSILQTAVREVGQALRVPQVTIRFQGAKQQIAPSSTPAITAESTVTDVSSSASENGVNHSNGVNANTRPVNGHQPQEQPTTTHGVMEER